MRKQNRSEQSLSSVSAKDNVRTARATVSQQCHPGSLQVPHGSKTTTRAAWSWRFGSSGACKQVSCTDAEVLDGTSGIHKIQSLSQAPNQAMLSQIHQFPPHSRIIFFSLAVWGPAHTGHIFSWKSAPVGHGICRNVLPCHAVGCHKEGQLVRLPSLG